MCNILIVEPNLDFPTTQVVNLEENYRSSGAIVDASIAVMSMGTFYV